MSHNLVWFKRSKRPVCLTEMPWSPVLESNWEVSLPDSQKISRALIPNERKLTKKRRDSRMSRGSDKERKRGGGGSGRENERGRREGLKEKEGWRLQRSSRHGRCQLQHSLSLFSPKQEPDFQAGLQLTVSCWHFSAAPGEESKSLLMYRDVRRRGQLPCYCT